MPASIATTALIATSEGQFRLPRSGARLATFLINLDDAEARRMGMVAALAESGLPFTLISAVDGRRLVLPHRDFSRAGYALLHGRRTSPPEIGCYLSHIAAARALLDSEADLALIAPYLEG